MCVSTFSVQERVLIWSMFWPSGLSYWTFVTIEGGIWISKGISFGKDKLLVPGFGYEEKNSLICTK